MPIVSSPYDLLESDIYVDLSTLVQHALYLKCEGFNFGGSIKVRAARGMVAAAERNGTLKPDSILLESSSGNLGIALSIVAASKGLRFICVTDLRCNSTTLQVMAALGTEVVVIDEPDPVSGLLGARKSHVQRLRQSDSRFLWLNQYENEANWLAHYEETAASMAKEFPDLDVLFVGTGTGGTLMGCARYFRDHAHGVRVVAVDTEGSVNLGGAAGTRLIPGIGSSMPAPALDLDIVDGIVHVAELDTIKSCRALAARGFLFGGSTGTVVSGATAWLDRNDPGRSLKSVAISADFGERYIGTIYNDQWVAENFPAHSPNRRSGHS